MERSSARLSRIRKYREEMLAEMGYLTVKEVATALRCRKERVVQLIATGLLAAVQDGKYRKIRVVDLERYMATRPVPSLPEPDPKLSHKRPKQQGTPPRMRKRIADLFL